LESSPKMHAPYSRSQEPKKPISKAWIVLTLALGFAIGWVTNYSDPFVTNEKDVGDAPLVDVIPGVDYGLDNDYSGYGLKGQQMLAAFKPGAVELFGPAEAPRWRPFTGVRIESEYGLGDGKNGKGAVAMCISFGKCCNYPEIGEECAKNLLEARPLSKVDIKKHYCVMTPYMKYPDKVDFIIYGLKLAGNIADHVTDMIPVVAEIKGVVKAIKGGVEALTGFDVWLPIQKFFNCLATTELSAKMHKMLLRSTLGLLLDDKTPRPGDLINYYFLLGLAHMGDEKAKIKPTSMSFICRIVYALRFGFLPGVFKQIKGSAALKWIFDTSNLGKLINFIVDGISNLLGPLGTAFKAITNEMAKQTTGGMLGDASGPSDDFAKTGLAMYFKDMRKKIESVLQGMTGNKEKFKELGQIFIHDAEMGWNDIADYFIEDVIAPVLFNGIFWYCDKQRDAALMNGEKAPVFFDASGVPMAFKAQVDKEEKNAACKGKEKFTKGTCYGRRLQKMTGSDNTIIACDKSRGPTQCFKHKCVCADGHYTENKQTCVPCGGGGRRELEFDGDVTYINVEDKIEDVPEVQLAEIPSELSDEQWSKLSYDEVWAQMKKEVADYEVAEALQAQQA